MKPLLTYSTLILLFSLGITCPVQADSWYDLQQRFPAEDHTEAVPDKVHEDPWARLVAFYLPYSHEDEERDQAKVQDYMQRKLAPFQHDIEQAAELFQVPEEVIAAVIMVESSGNPRARAKTSTAKGLMQTIDATFKMAREGLAKQGVTIINDPYDSTASIYAGTWYLNEMFKLAVRDGRVSQSQRDTLSGWRTPVEYYYAGPGHGRKAQSIVLIYAGGKRLVVDKAKYSGKVMGWLDFKG